MDELDQIKKLAGINEFKGLKTYEGINVSISGTEKRKLEREHDIRPGTPEWFQLWFSLPYLTNEKFGDKQWLR
jgi:hypothetical protein